jgi:hypothetical protein
MGFEALEEYEGHPVVQTGLRLRGAGDGLSNAMKVDPQVLHHGDTVFLVVEATVARVSYDPVKGNEELFCRVHDLRSSAATIVPKELVADALGEHKERLERVRESEKGIQRLPTTNELTRQHELGLHEALTPGCAECNAELDATSGPADVGVVAPISGRKRRTDEDRLEAVLSPNQARRPRRPKGEGA